MADNNQPITGLYKFNGNLFDPSKSTTTSTFDDWMYGNPNSYQKYLSKGGEYRGTGSKYDSNTSLSKFGSKDSINNPNNVGNELFSGDNKYENIYKSNYAMQGKPVHTFEIPNTGSDGYVDPISATTNSSTALTSGTGIPSFLTPTNTSASWSGTINGVTGNTGSVPPLSTMGVDDRLKELQIKVGNKYLDELEKPAPTFLGMDRANVGLSMQGLGLASQLFSEFGSDGNRKLRKEQIGALKDDRNRANEEQQAIRDYRNSYK